MNLLSVLALSMSACLLLGADASKPVEKKLHDLPFVKPPARFEQLKTLVGKWEGTEQQPGGKQSIAVEYELTSAGTVLVEKLHPGKKHEMLSIYHGDGNQILMTHYCALGNQPRMKLERTDNPKVMKFSFKDGTSLKSAGDPHMHQLTMTFLEKDNLLHEWVYFEGGKQKSIVQFNLKRKKPSK